MSTKYKVGSLFAGVGGVCLGFKNASYKEKEYEMIWANEMDEFACETYRTNFSHTLIQGDINKVLNPEIIDEEILSKKRSLNSLDGISETKYIKEIEKLEEEKNGYVLKHKQILSEKIDILLGGFPCQAFSIAGERKGFEDDRGNLFLSIINLINQLDQIHGKPRVLFLENVKNLKGHDGGRTYQVIKSELEKIGYIIKEHVLNTMDYTDLPQNRERIYIIGFLNKEDADKFELFNPIDNKGKVLIEKMKKHKSKEDRINDIRRIIRYDLTRTEAEKYYYTREKYPNYFLTQEEYDNLPLDLKKDERVNLDEQINEFYEFYQVRRGMYVRKNKSGVCPTLTANMGTGGHNVPIIKVNDGIRKLTPEEVFKLQGFPVGKGYKLPTKYNGRAYSDAQLYKQAGNAVSVPIIELLAKNIIKIL